MQTVLQHLSNHVWMVLASADDMSLEALAQLAKKIMEVATPTVVAVHISPLASKVKQLHAEIDLLKDTLASLQLPSNHSVPRLFLLFLLDTTSVPCIPATLWKVMIFPLSSTITLSRMPSQPGQPTTPVVKPAR